MSDACQEREKEKGKEGGEKKGNMFSSPAGAALAYAND